MDAFCHSGIGTSESLREFDVVRDSSGRRRWSREEKARLVAESEAPGMTVLAVAGRHGIDPNRIYMWRRQKRARGSVPVPAQLAFVPLVSGDVISQASSDCDSRPAAGGVCDVVIGSMTVRVGATVQADFLRRVLDVVRGLA